MILGQQLQIKTVVIYNVCYYLYQCSLSLFGRHWHWVITLMLGHSQFLGNTKYAVSEDNILSGNTSGNMVVMLERMTIRDDESDSITLMRKTKYKRKKLSNETQTAFKCAGSHNSTKYIECEDLENIKPEDHKHYDHTIAPCGWNETKAQPVDLEMGLLQSMWTVQAVRFTRVERVKQHKFFCRLTCKILTAGLVNKLSVQQTWKM